MVVKNSWNKIDVNLLPENIKTGKTIFGIVWNVIEMNNIIDSFWDWSDWNVTISTSVDMTQDMYYDILTINSPWILNPNWYKLFARKLMGDGKIQRNGNNWGDGWDPTASEENTWGGLAGTTLNQGSLNAEVAWSAGWNRAWNATAWKVWSAWADSNPSYSLINWVAWWDWWDWYSTWWWDWWIAGVSTRATYYDKRFLFDSLLWWSQLYKWIAWNWGGGGWGSRGWVFTTWGGGGWSWTNWWFIWCAIYEIDRTWTFESIGWDGGNWWIGTSEAWKWGGGSPWNWGVIFLLYRILTSLWSVVNTPGNKWLKWASWLDTWATDGNNWNSWILLQFQV